MLREKAKALFDAHNPYPGPALWHHNLRIAAFCLALGRRRRVPIHEDLLYAGCHLHDIGLLIPERGEPSYLRRSWQLVEPHAREWGVEGKHLRILSDMLLYNHALRPVPGIAPMADLVRRSVQIEHSRGRVRHGLTRRQCKDVFEGLPRLDLTRILLDFTRITMLEDGPGQIWPMFFPRSGGA